MQQASLPIRILLLPVDLVRMIVLALRISFWHARVVCRSTILGLPPSHSFCHPVRMRIRDVKTNVCPFAVRFANPRLFSWLCEYCHLSSQGSRRGIPFCRRRGGGPASSITQICCGVFPVVVTLLIVIWIMRPTPGMIGDAQRYLVDPEPNANVVSTSPRPPPSPANAEDGKQPEVGSADASTDSQKQLSPMPLPKRSAKDRADIPPPPMGFSPLDRRLAGVELPTTTTTPAPAEEAKEPAPAEDKELRWAREAAAKGDFAAALALAQRSAAKGSMEALLLIARSRLESGKKDEARAVAEGIVAADPKVAEAHAILGKIHLDNGNLEKAKASYEQALQLDPECRLARIGMTRIELLKLPGKD